MEMKTCQSSRASLFYGFINKQINKFYFSYVEFTDRKFQAWVELEMFSYRKYIFRPLKNKSDSAYAFGKIFVIFIRKPVLKKIDISYPSNFS